MQFDGPSKGKESAAASAKREREQRRQRKREEDAACAIGRWWRRVCSRRQAMRGLREAYDAEVAKHFEDSSSVAALKLRPMRVQLPHRDGILAMATLLMRSIPPARCRRHPPHLDLPEDACLFVFRLVSTSISRPSADHSFSAAISDPRFAHSWPACTSRLLVAAEGLLLLYLQTASRVNFLTVLKLLLDVTTVRTWAFLRQESPDAKQRTLQAAAVALPQLLGSITNPAMFSAIAGFFASPLHSTSADDVVTAAVISLCTRLASASPAGAALFVTHVLASVSGLRSKLTKDAYNTLTGDRRLWERAFAFIQSSDLRCPEALRKGGGGGSSTAAAAAAPASPEKGSDALLATVGTPPQGCLEGGATGGGSCWPLGCLVGNVLEIGRCVARSQPGVTQQWGAAVSRLVECVPPRSEMARRLDENATFATQLRLLWDHHTLSLLFQGLLDGHGEGNSNPAAGGIHRASSIFSHMRSQRPVAGGAGGASPLPPRMGAAHTASVSAAVAAIALSAGVTVSEVPFRPPLLQSWEAPPWLHACRLFNGLVYSFDPNSAINALASHPHLVTALWDHIVCNAFSFNAFVVGECLPSGLPDDDKSPQQDSPEEAPGGAEGRESAFAESAGHTLLLFLHCYDHLLAVAGDAEFYGMQLPFRLTCVSSMVSLFAKLAFRLMWEGQPGATSQAASVTPFEKQRGNLYTRLLLESRSLLQKLQQRNTRRVFCPPSNWQVEDFKQARGFNFAHVLKYLNDNISNNPFENLFGVLRELTTEMMQSADPLERHFGDIFGNLRSLFSGLHDVYRRPSVEACSVTTDEGLQRYQAVIASMPYIVSYTERLEYLRCLIERDRQANHASDVKFPITVRRPHVLLDCMREFYRIEHAASHAGKLHLKAQLHVKFLNAEGVTEDGIDEGGLFKELLEIVIRKAFSPELGFFVETDGNADGSYAGKLHPNPKSCSAQIESMKNEKNADIFAFYNRLGLPTLDFFKFLGRVLAKAVYEGVVVELPFAEFFLNTLLGQTNYVEDLASLDPVVHRSVVSMKEMDDVSSLGLTFSVDDTSSANGVHNLLPNGSQIPVTHSNIGTYMSLYANYKLNVQFSEQAIAFLSGFQEILPPSMLALFNRNELQQLISGLEGSFDILELRKHTRYDDYTDDHPVIESFWEVLGGFTDEQKGDFLRFVMSSARPPLLGFGHINPPFMIRKMPALPEGAVGGTPQGGEQQPASAPATATTTTAGTQTSDLETLPAPQEEAGGGGATAGSAPPSGAAQGAGPRGWHRLPTSSTCFNLLSLPAYPTKENLRDRLLYAISSGTGFELL